MKKLISKSDVIFTVALVAAILLLWFFTLPRAAGGMAVFRHNGEILASLPLLEDATYEIDGTYHTVFEIRDGAVRVAHTTCPNRQCEKTGAVAHAGESIVCAPNGATVTITGEEAEIDGVTG